MGLTAARTARPLTVAIGVALVCLAVESSALGDRTGGEPRNDDIRRYVLGEVYDPYRVEQRFLVKADGLSSITVHPRPASPSPTGDVRLSLYELAEKDQRTLVHQQSMALVSMAQADAVTLRFASQQSRYRTYSLEITVDGSSDGQGIGFLAARGDGYRAATLLINGRPQFGDLIFETTVDDARTSFGAVASQAARGGIPAAPMVILLVLVLKYAALIYVVAAFTRAVAAASRTPQGSPTLRGS